MQSLRIDNSLPTCVQTVEEYERRERTIQRLTEEIEGINGDLVGKEEKMAELKAK